MVAPPSGSVLHIPLAIIVRTRAVTNFIPLQFCWRCNVLYPASYSCYLLLFFSILHFSFFSILHLYIYIYIYIWKICDSIVKHTVFFVKSLFLIFFHSRCNCWAMCDHPFSNFLRKTVRAEMGKGIT